MNRTIYNHCGHLFILTLVALSLSSNIFAQGTWLQLTNYPPDYNSGVMLLLSDGTVISKTTSGPGDGTVWDKLTPDSHGSYANGTWSTIAPMYNDRLYFSSQVLMNGQVYVAGGEYGGGFGSAEVYDPIADLWTQVPPLTSADTFYDANSEILPDGKVLQSSFFYSQDYRGNYIYDPVTNTFSMGTECTGIHAETTWLKLADSSILFVDWGLPYSGRYIPSLGAWIADGTLPGDIYDSIMGETGPAFLLPDGRAFFLGGKGFNAFYSPSGTNSPGVWTAGPKMPDSMAMDDAAGAMMVNGKILIAAAKIPDTFAFPSPTAFYLFDYTTDSFTQISSPYGGDTLSGPPFDTHMLNLPDGTVLLSVGWYGEYAIYVPDGTPLPAGKPSIDNIIQVSCDTYQVSGKLFNGITEGSCYGDDWQMATNYPLVRLTSGTNVYYARTYNWNSTGVMTGNQEDSTMFVLPSGLPGGTYDLAVVANGNASVPDTFTFTPCSPSGIAQNNAPGLQYLNVYPNPATDKTTVAFYSNNGGQCTIRLTDIVGQTITQATYNAQPGSNKYTLQLNGIAGGVYLVVVQQDTDIYQVKVLVE